MKKLILLTYNLRAGTDPDEYDRFMRTTDYQVFRERPEVLDYRAYRVTQDVQRPRDFRYFDLLYVNDHADMETIFGHPAVQQNAATWIERYSEHGPDADPEANFGVTFAEQIWG
jgi:hypothetical protein